MSQRTRHARREGRHRLLVTEGVLFPSTRLQFHFIDPQRRALVRQAMLEEGRLLLRPKDESFESDIATLAEIVDYLEFSPQRTAVTLGGIERVRLVGVEPREGHAMATWRRVDELVSDCIACNSLVADILGTLDHLSKQGVELAGEVASMAAEARDPSAVADIVGSVTFERGRDQLEHLAQINVYQRLVAVHSRLVTIVNA
ncbi:hypothetical protein FIV42_25140 [Persicimonas caeni]|uniref:Lon N-terminal domain-containing protein n=1 Tax=Persicimonas caeni TaxID=2292766 RepID=A0A4Y6Q102_PERCE|nr:LON peptidase substrate-binding domain-containing protein [Persicimonas caeni]QDG53907.1 hypothetical protein FIV42_25140 [Persicimonas caeni]QED35128.1 hypothetical protein FRD00_25135 [Persicimonas caeni]